MTNDHQCPMFNKKLAERMAEDLAAIKAPVEFYLGNGKDGKLPIKLDALEEKVEKAAIEAAKLPCVSRGERIANLEKKIGWIERYALLQMGAILIMGWMLSRIDSFISALKLAAR